MDRQQAQRIIKETFEQPFDKERFASFNKNLLNRIDAAPFTYQGQFIPHAYREYISTLERIGKFSDGDNRIDILIIKLQKQTSLERARSMQRNFIAWYLNGSRGGELKDAALVAFVSPDETDWRFSLVKMDYKFEQSPTGKVKVKEEFTPARRWSFLVGVNEKSHTAQSRLVKILANDEQAPTLAELEEAFNIETVTKEFFAKYRDLFVRTKEALDTVVKTNVRIKSDFDAKGVNSVDFAKKLLGQIVFLYFLQKKGWFGVGRDDDWGTGSRHFLRELFDNKHGQYQNFFNDVLEHLFYDALRDDRSHNDYYYSQFNCKIPFLNGGLFDPIGSYDWVHTDINLPDNLFSNKTKTKAGDIGDGILDIFDRYNFTVKEDEPLEKEVAIDPELLGKAYEKFNAIRPDNFEEYKKALKSGKKSDESKFNKQFGVYYTPREIVHYMCQQSLINYLHTELNSGQIGYEKLGESNLDMFGNKIKQGQWDLTIEHRAIPEVKKEAIEALIHSGEQVSENEARVESKGKETSRYSYKLPEIIRKNADLIDRKLAAITVCDPAVGSGAFPVGMMSEIVKARNVLSMFIHDGRDVACNVSTITTTRAIYDFKRQCIEHSLYGVDIDPGAVEIAKLRLWLSLVVDEDDIKNIKPLPNLDYKIVCGNSLLGVKRDLLNDYLFKELETLKPLYFNETNPSKKQDYKKQIDNLISRITNGHKEFDFEVYFSEVFHQKGGFHVVIANPPYVRQEEIKELKPALQKQFECYTGTSDLFVYFYEKGIRLLRSNGVLVFISSNKYFRSGYGEKLRSYLGSKTRILQVIDFGDAPIFDAIAYPSILVTQKAAPDGNQFNALDWKLDEPLKKFHDVLATQTFIMHQSDLTADGWRLENRSVLNLLEKLRRSGKPLSEYVNGRIYRGVVTGLNEAFVVDKATRKRLIAENPSSAEVLKPFLRGRDVKRWQIDYQDLWLIFTRRGIDIKKYPAILKYLKQYKDQLTPGVEGGRKPGSYEWYEIQDNTAYWQEFEKPKIIYPNICQRNEFTWDDSGYFTNQKAFIISDGSRYLVAILNSQVVMWLFTKLLPKLQGNFFEPSEMFMKEFPIPSTKDTKKIESLVNPILAAKRTNPHADTSKFEREIDQMVYELYGLTEEEIRIVEGGK